MVHTLVVSPSAQRALSSLISSSEPVPFRMSMARESVTCEALGRGIFWGKLHHRRVLVRVVDPSHNSLAEVPSGGAIRVADLGLQLDRRALSVWARESFFFFPFFGWSVTRVFAYNARSDDV